MQNSDPWSTGRAADEAAAVERWLDAHPAFVRDYMMRCPTPAVLEYILGTRGVPTSTTSHDTAVTSTDAAMTGSTSSRVGSGANTPVRKVSTKQFQKRGTLSRMVMTVDGVPSFLAAGGGTPDESPSESGASCRQRTDLESLDSCQLMNELILDICNDLDVTSLSHKILQNVCLLLSADRCSLFHVERRHRGSSSSSDGSEERCMASKLFNVSAHSTVSECSTEDIRVAWGSGIVGHVAMTGNAVNIPDAYEACITVFCSAISIEEPP